MPSGRLILPREHGAYAELTFPLLTGLLCAPPKVATVAFAVAAALVFLAHEPLAVATGTRGGRRRADQGDAAFRQLGWLVAGATVAAVTGLLVASSRARLAVLIPTAWVIALVPWLAVGRLKTLAAEVVVIGAFAATVMPLSIASGRDWSFGSTAAWVWFAGLSLETLAVHALKARHKRTRGAAAATGTSVAGAFLVLTLTGAAAARGWMPWLAVFALAPSGLFTLVVALWTIHTRHLKRIGWSLVGANMVTLACLVAIR